MFMYIKKCIYYTLIIVQYFFASTYSLYDVGLAYSKINTNKTIK